MNKTRITYRLDHQNQKPAERINNEEGSRVIPLYENEFRVVDDTQLAPEYVNDYGAWNSPFDAETRRIEQLIRESNSSKRNELSARQNPHLPDNLDERFLKDDFNARPEVVQNQAHYIQRGIPWIKIVSTAIGAVVTGVLLGFFIISMFSKTQTTTSQQPVNSAVPTLSQANENKTADTAGDASSSQPVTSLLEKTVSLQIPSRTYTFLQNGSFSKAQSANQEVADVRNKGFAAVAETADKFNVYVGVAADHQGAQTLSQQLRAQKLEIYLKPYILPALEAAKWRGTPTGLQNYCMQADQLVQMLSGITLVHLEETELTPIADTTIQSIETAHAAWTASSTQIAADAPAKEHLTLQKMSNALNTAKRSGEEYNKNPSHAMLWQIQTNLIQFIIAEKTFLNDVAAV